MSYYAGIDIGSATTKVALLFEEKIVGHKVAPSGVHCEETARKVLAELCQDLDLEQSVITNITATGYGRRMVKFANSTISEISANVQGAIWYGSQSGQAIRTIINIGGQDSKVIALDDQGVTKNFAMNDKCAAGTGRFLETLCRIMEINITELGVLALQSTVPIRINSTCAVFAESEVVSLLARGKKKADIIAGAHHGIAKRLGRMTKRVGLEDTVFFDGGPALNIGLRKALEDELITDIYVPPEVPQVTTAVGAALIAREQKLFGRHVEEVA
ncbi:MAG: benzoyl-CoA reductase [Magnetococcales bacterium]|nr:benzoyl-CoA reductase [Magnetococcales bacterium]